MSIGIFNAKTGKYADALTGDEKANILSTIEKRAKTGGPDFKEVIGAMKGEDWGRGIEGLVRTYEKLLDEQPTAKA